MRRLSLSGFLLIAAVAATPSSPLDAQEAHEPSPSPKPSAKQDHGLRILDPVVCKSIEGYEDYEELPEAELTSDEKLLVYYRPKGHKVVHKGEEYIAHLVQDGQVRRLGQKKVLLRKAKLLDYEAKSETPPDELYIRNTFSLKGLPPGEYEYDMILKDLNAKDATVTESVKFRVVAAKLPESEPDAKPKSDEDARF